MALAEAVNKSGHTILSSEVRADDIPWFVKVPNVSEIPDYVTSRGLALNDIVFAGNYSLSGTGGIQAKIYKGDNNWENLDISTSPTLFNKDGKAVIQVHYNVEIEYITGNENAGISSDRWAAFIKSKTKENERVYQFVSSTDKVYKGIPSLGYTAYIESNNKKVYEGTNDDDYIVNAFAGVIQFNKQRGETESLRGIIFEYIGDHISDNIATLNDDLDKHITDDTEHIKNIKGDDYITATLNDNKNGFEIGLNVATTISDSDAGTGKVANYSATKSYVDNLKNTEHNQSVTKDGVTVSLTGTLGNPVIGLGVSHNDTIDDSTKDSATAPTTAAVYSFVGDIKDIVDAEIEDIDTKIAEISDEIVEISNDVESHKDDTERHITNEERKAWNELEGYFIDEIIDSEKNIKSYIADELDDIKKYVDTAVIDKTVSITSSNESITVTHNIVVDGEDGYDLSVGDNYYNKSDTDNAISTAVTSHTNNTDILHVTPDEKNKWNNALSELTPGTDISIAGTTISVAEDARTSWDNAASEATRLNGEISALLKVETNDIDDDNKKYALMMTAESSDITLTNNQFKHPLTSLVIGDRLFADNSTITKFESNLPNLTYAESMFSDCTALTSFNVGLYNLSNLVTGTNMFNGCTNLVSFNGNLSSLSSARGMFTGCNNLSANSISMIVSSIKDWSKETDDTTEHVIGIPTSSISGEDYAKLEAKGWTIE